MEQDAEQPGARVGSLHETGAAAPRPQHGFLHQILGSRAIAAQPAGHAQQTGHVRHRYPLEFILPRTHIRDPPCQHLLYPNRRLKAGSSQDGRPTVRVLNQRPKSLRTRFRLARGRF